MTQQRQRYQRTLVVEDGDPFYDTPAEVVALMQTAGSSFQFIWQLTVPAQVGMRWGYGDARLPDNQGLCSFSAVDAATEQIVGLLELRASDAPRTRTHFARRFTTSRLNDGTSTTALTSLSSDRRSVQPLPENGPQFAQDSTLELWFKHLAGTLANLDDVAFNIDASVYT